MVRVRVRVRVRVSPHDATRDGGGITGHGQG